MKSEIIILKTCTEEELERLFIKKNQSSDKDTELLILNDLIL